MEETDTRQTPFRDAAQQASPRTPKRKLNELIQSETPHVQRTSGNANYAFGTLDQRREAVMNELPSLLPELPVQTFIEHLLPKIRLEEDKFEKICKRVVEKKIYNVVEAKWPSLGESGKEMKDFLEFHSIQSSIVNIAEGILRLSSAIGFASDGHKIPESDWKGNDKARPDGGVALQGNKRRESDWHWMNIFRVDEFKSGESPKDKYDNLSKCMWALHHILSQDKSRRFAFGLTIANRTARLFFACRSFVAASREFNICKEWKVFVRITTVFAFASEEQLGWDTTVILTNKSPEAITLQIKDRCFTTMETINDTRAFSLLGRATRVFLAKDDKGNRVVIKDVWVDETRKREHQIQQEIFDDFDAADLSSMKMHFFNHILYDDVPTSDHEADSTKMMCKSIDGDDLDFSKFGQFPTDPPSGAFNLSNSIGDLRSHNTSAQSVNSLNFRKVPPTVMHRVHYRLVMKEEATPLQNILEVKDSMTILKHLNTLIFAPAEISWVHRDLSVINVYSFIDDLGEPELKLGDLEYAKKFGEGEQAGLHDVRTGTRWFWSVEIEAGGYLYHLTANRARQTSTIRTKVEKQQRPVDGKHQDFLKRVEKPMPQIDPPHDEDRAALHPTKRAEFRHNPLHELESLWWMTLYCFAMRKVSEPATNWDEAEQQRRLVAAFPTSSNTASRRDVFTRASELYANPLQCLVHTLDSRIEPLQEHLSQMSKLLLNAFKKVESTLPDHVNHAGWALGPDSEGATLYTELKKELEALCDRTWPKLDFLGNGVEKKRKIFSEGNGSGTRSSKGSHLNGPC